MKSKPAYLTLLLALLHGMAGITILFISSWFIKTLELVLLNNESLLSIKILLGVSLISFTRLKN